jgi:hypothetical protein
MSLASPLRRSLLTAALIVGASAALAWLSPSHLSAELAHRLLGALLGAVVVVYANAVPKALASRSSLRCSPAEEQAARRFGGWALVLGGLGYMLAALLAPLAYATLLGGVLLAVSLLLAVLRYARLGAFGSRS